MKKKNVLVMIFAVLFMAACSSNKEKEVTVSDVDISGFIKDYVKVVDGSYKFTHNGKEAFITIKLELTNKPIEYCKGNWGSVKLNAIDENGSILSAGTHGFQVDHNEIKKIEDLLKGKVGETKTILVTWQYYNQNTELGSVIFKNAKSFELLDEGFSDCSDAEKVTENLGYEEIADSPDMKESHSSADFDKLLNDYESFLNRYIALLKQSKNGDMNSLTASMELMSKAAEIAEQLSDAKGQLNAQQVKRFTDIAMKFSKAATELQ